MSDPADDAAFGRILDYLRDNRGVDLTAYKPASLMRRVLRRMEAVDVRGFDAYLDFLQVRPDEFRALFNAILINVTRFFRDPEVWDQIASTVIPSLLEARPVGTVRVWSAGCAAGHEAYTIAILLAERLGLDAFRDRVKIYATDVDDEALSEARHATYPAKQIADVPEQLRARYFDSIGDRFAVKREIRRGVIFGHHDLLQDAPISRVDLLLCRNALMYFNGDAQGRIISKFSFSIGPDGYLVLGRAEMLLSHAARFEPVDLKCRIFKSAQTNRLRDRRLLAVAGGREGIVPQPPDTRTRLRELAFENGRDPQIVVDAAGIVAGANAAARRHFGVAPSDVGTPFQNLELSYRPAELRAQIDRAMEERHEILVRGVTWNGPEGPRYLDVAIAPLVAEDGTLLGTRVSFVDVTNLTTLQDDLRQSKQELETASGELHSTNEELETTNEELETTNEELQSTVEELETTNEELQSTNEELETVNEELQSTNEELQTMNDELRCRGVELNVANIFLESVLTSLRSAVVVLDRDMRIQVWNQGAVDLWGLRADEAVGASFVDLDIGLPVQSLLAAVGDVLDGRTKESQSVVPATNRKGRALRCKVISAPLAKQGREIAGVILVMEEDVVLA